MHFVENVARTAHIVHAPETRSGLASVLELPQPEAAGATISAVPGRNGCAESVISSNGHV